MTPTQSHYDLVFLGGGLASSMVSRYLKLKNPTLKILVLEKGTQAHWSPGESTVGVAGLFMIRDLGLSTYAYLNQLPKNGLRFFFTKGDAKFDLTQCSEIGSSRLPVFPTFQIDRKRIVEDLWKLNEQAGIELKLGCKLTDLQISSESTSSHKITYQQSEEASHITCNWVINASGRTSQFVPVFNQLSEFQEDQDHCTAAAWGRYTNVVDIDRLGNEEWKRKVGFTSRYLSTNHFMGEGYWIWAIPIDRGVVSFGVVYDKKVIREDLTQNDAFNAFLKKHPICGLLLEGAKQEDFQSHPHLPFKRKVFCSESRWALIGDSFMFVDPFYSPGSDVIAREARHIEHLIRCKPDELGELTKLLNQYTQLEFDLLKSLYVNQYAGFGSYEVYDIKSYWDFYSYTNAVLWPFYSKYHENINWLKGQVAAGGMTLNLVQAIQNGFIQLYSHLRENGQLERYNNGKYSARQNHFEIEDRMVLGQYSNEASRKHHTDLCRVTISEIIESRFGLNNFVVKKAVQDQLSLQEMSQFELTKAWLEQFLEKVGHAFSEQIESKSGEKIDCQITLECFKAPLPGCFRDSSQAIRALASDIWQERTQSVVKFRDPSQLTIKI